MGKLPEFHSMMDLHCCMDNCVMVSLSYYMHVWSVAEAAVGMFLEFQSYLSICVCECV